MHSAAAIIDALNARTAPPGRMREAARASWSAWMARLAERPGRIVGAPAQELVDQLAARPVYAPPARSGELGRWQAFTTLWRQQWHPAARDERGWRWTAGGTSFAWHLLLAVVLAWIATLPFFPPEPEESEAIQVEYIGIGTPDERGGGEPPAPGEQVNSPAEAASAASPDAAAAPTPAPSMPSTPGMPAPDIEAPVPEIAAREVPEPRPAPQPLAVSPPVSPEPPVFELPPTTRPEPSIALPDAARVPPVRVVDLPEPVRAPPVEITTPQLAVEPVRAPTPSVAQRDVPAPVRLPTVGPSAPPIAAPSVQARTPQVARRDVRAPAASREVATSTAASPTRAPAGASPATAGTRAGDAASASGPPVATRNPGIGTGPQATPAPGSWATPRRADDWGESDRNAPGRGDGVSDGDGRPRIAAAPGSAAPGRPPGTHTEEIASLDRAGTWLKRKPYPYEPTRFDRFWRPNETLLQEWVRRGIKQVSIPIPGSSKRIVCGISILQLGGGCWAEDPNVNEQPATARPPPDIPFKPRLQEDPGATSPAGRPPGADGVSGGVGRANVDDMVRAVRTWGGVAGRGGGIRARAA